MSKSSTGQLDYPNRMLSPEICRESIRASNHYVYFNNAEAGCATIKQALWRLSTASERVPTAAEIHAYPSIWCPLEQIDDFGAKFKFSFVRNPYQRAFSCYREKIQKQCHVRSRFLAQYKFAKDASVDFETFLAAIGDTDPADDDQHWRLQAANLLVSAVDLDWIGHLETLDADIEPVAERIGLPLPIERRQGAAEDGEDRIEISPGARRLIERKYELDFQLFGYQQDPAILIAQFEAGPINTSTPAGMAAFEGFITGSPQAFARARQVKESDTPEVRAGEIRATGQPQEAQRLLAEALRIWPNDPGLLALSLEGTTGPRAWYLTQRLCEVEPHRPGNWMRLGNLQREHGDASSALSSYQYALFLQPRSKGALQAAADAAEALGRTRLASDFQAQLASL